MDRCHALATPCNVQTHVPTKADGIGGQGARGARGARDARRLRKQGVWGAEGLEIG